MQSPYNVFWTVFNFEVTVVCLQMQILLYKGIAFRFWHIAFRCPCICAGPLASHRTLGGEGCGNVCPLLASRKARVAALLPTQTRWKLLLLTASRYLPRWEILLGCSWFSDRAGIGCFCSVPFRVLKSWICGILYKISHHTTSLFMQPALSLRQIVEMTEEFLFLFYHLVVVTAARMQLETRL